MRRNDSGVPHLLDPVRCAVRGGYLWRAPTDSCQHPAHIVHFVGNQHPFHYNRGGGGGGIDSENDFDGSA